MYLMINGCATEQIFNSFKSYRSTLAKKCKFVVVEMVATATYISIVSIFITTKQKTKTAELDFSIVSIVFDSQSENYCKY